MIRCALLVSEEFENAVMSSHVGASGVNGSSRSHGGEDAGEEDSNNGTQTLCLKAVRPRLRSTDPAGEGRSSAVEQLVRPPLPGRKAHKKTCSKDNTGRWRAGNEDKEEEGLTCEHVVGRERGKQKQRMPERTETHGDGAQDKQERGSTESLSSSNSDIQINNTLETGEGSNLQRSQTCLRPRSVSCTRTITANTNPQSPWPAVRPMSFALPQPPVPTRSASLSPQRLSSRTAAGELHRYSFSSSRELNPSWVDVRRGGGTERSSQSHHAHTYNPSLTSSELGEEEEEEGEEAEEEDVVEDGEEGGSGVMEVMSQTSISAVVPPPVPFGEKRISKREKNRIKCLRRRQRRRERWRQSQLQESRQVNDTLLTDSSIRQCIPKTLFLHQMFI